MHGESEDYYNFLLLECNKGVKKKKQMSPSWHILDAVWVRWHTEKKDENGRVQRKSGKICGKVAQKAQKQIEAYKKSNKLCLRELHYFVHFLQFEQCSDLFWPTQPPSNLNFNLNSRKLLNHPPT